MIASISAVTIITMIAIAITRSVPGVHGVSAWEPSSLSSLAHRPQHDPDERGNHADHQRHAGPLR